MSARDEMRAAISNAYYEARNNGRTMEQAADDAVAGVLGVIATMPDDKSLRLAVHKAITDRLSWASLHWGTEDVHPDAWPHVARAAIVGVAAALTHEHDEVSA